MQQWLYIDDVPVSLVDELKLVRPGEYEFQIQAPMLDTYEELNGNLSLRDEGPVYLKCTRWGYHMESVHISAVDVGESPELEDEDWLVLGAQPLEKVDFQWNGEVGQYGLLKLNLKMWDELGLYIDCRKCRNQWCQTEVGYLCYHHTFVPVASFLDQTFEIVRLRHRQKLRLRLVGTELHDDILSLLVKVTSLTGL